MSPLTKDIVSQLYLKTVGNNLQKKFHLNKHLGYIHQKLSYHQVIKNNPVVINTAIVRINNDALVTFSYCALTPLASSLGCFQKEIGNQKLITIKQTNPFCGDLLLL
ncbi:MAG: hypothetical protein ACTIJQ_10895 [Alcaligenes sp.]